MKEKQKHRKVTKRVKKNRCVEYILEDFANYLSAMTDNEVSPEALKERLMHMEPKKKISVSKFLDTWLHWVKKGYY